MKLIIILSLILQFPTGLAQSLFNDNSLELLLKNNKAGIIFLWSPFMPLSLRGLEEITEIAESNDIALKILIDPHPLVNFESSDSILDSQTLISLGMLNHFPSVILYKHGSLLPWMIQGFENKKSLEIMIKNRLGDL